MSTGNKSGCQDDDKDDGEDGVLRVTLEILQEEVTMKGNKLIKGKKR